MVKATPYNTMKRRYKGKWRTRPIAAAIVPNKVKLHCSQVPVGISVDPAYIKTGQIPGRYCEKEKQAVNKQCFADCSRGAGIADADADFVQRERRILLVFLCGKREAAQDSHTKDGSENISHERCPERI